jgi:hypothetical protein
MSAVGFVSATSIVPFEPASAGPTTAPSDACMMQ